jgi:hypothetical protein
MANEQSSDEKTENEKEVEVPRLDEQKNNQIGFGKAEA